MKLNEALKKLENFGTPQNRKIYKRHGVKAELYGVSYANLKKLAKDIKTNHELSRQLWATANHDARILATMVADPEQIKTDVDQWVSDLDNYVITDAVSSLVARSTIAKDKSSAWIKSKHEWISSAGWNIISILATKNKNIEIEYFKPLLPIIKDTIHQAKNRTRHSMNMALIAIGLRAPEFTDEAIRIAGEIGKVDVDHGETNCKTPDAVEYIKKANNRRRTHC